MAHPDTRNIFGEAIEISSRQDRILFLDRACQGMMIFAATWKDLLKITSKPVAFLNRRRWDFAVTTDSPPSSSGPGTVIGPYKLLQQIGEGGMGVVFMAEQQRPVRRRVALKVIKPGMDTRQVIARFEAERQALALMDHPNISRVLDAGATESGRPYFVMELVRGVPLTRVLRSEPSDGRRAVGAVHYRLPCRSARPSKRDHPSRHQADKRAGDLHDGTPVAKVIDFGVAKATGQQLTEKTLFTSFAQMIGTPLYMSPEQAEMSGLDVDTRSDIYSLGVLLYELLTGTTPFDQERLRDGRIR